MTNNIEVEKIKSNIQRLSDFIDTAYLKTDDEKFFAMTTDYSLFVSQIESIYKHWFPKAKQVSDLGIIDHLFKDIFKKDEKQYVKYSMQCLLRSVARVFSDIEHYKNIAHNELLLANIGLLKEIAFEATIFIRYAFEIMEGVITEFGNGKRFRLEPRETLNASEFILKNVIPKNLVGNTAIAPTSTFLIRQAIELWLQNIFGIHSVWDDHEKKFIKVQPERLFLLLDNNGTMVKTPVPKASIQKIHAWTQRYVHNGMMNSVWEIEHAQYILRPLFYSKNVIISKEYYDSIETRIQEIFNNPNLRLNRREQWSSIIQS